MNKFSRSNDLEHATKILYELFVGLSETNAPMENAIRTIFWIAKALILRLWSLNDVLERLLALLPKDNYGAAAARGFRLLFAPDEMLSKENGATVRLLAKQKVFSSCIPRIAKDFRAADNSVKQNFLVAMSGILKFMPTQVIMQETDSILPLLLQSLDLEDADVKAATIQTLAVISAESPGAVESHISSIVKRLLKSASNAQSNGPIVRLNALKCLKIFPGRVKDSALLPHRNAVTRGLTAPLDDPKRDVRKEAVECRTAWLNMDEPDSD